MLILLNDEHTQLTPEYKKLGELVAKDPKLSGRVVVAKV